MNALALVIGNSKYTLRKHVLPNAEKDAVDISNKLISLGFTVDKLINCNGQEFERGIQLFSAKRKKFDIGLLYFAGHGLQIKGINYLTAIDTQFEDETAAKYSCYELSKILDYMDVSKSSENSINVIVLDACRDNPFDISFRGINNQGLAPVNAPKGTIIAYSTSPGQTASDGKKGENSVYANAFLNHIDDRNIPIEEFFKRVRTTVYTMTNGDQTSWEHTSLIGDFYFNSTELNHSVNLPYEKYAIVDSEFVSDGSDIQEIISQMRSHDFYSQRPALTKFKNIDKFAQLDPSDLFLMGRNILQAAHGGENSAQKFMDNPAYWLSGMANDEENHVLNGILFEMYFDSHGRFRKVKFKNDYLDQIYSLENENQYIPAFETLRQQLGPFKNRVFYFPGDTTIPIEVKLERYEYMSIQKKLKKGLKLTSLKYQGYELLDASEEDEDSAFNLDKVLLSELKSRISKLLMVPLKKLRISLDKTPLDDEPISIPRELKLMVM